MGRRGLSLVEAVLSVILVSVLLVASVNTVGASRAAQSATSNRSWGNVLAQGLMSEILQQSYADPASGEVKVFSFGPGADQLPVPVLGPESGEAGDGPSA
jgi:Tfp pilus assembly protein PilV